LWFPQNVNRPIPQAFTSLGIASAFGLRYPVSMKDTYSMNIIPDPIQDQLLLLAAGRGQARTIICEVVTRFALRGSLIVLDGGNGFDAYRIARMIRRENTDIDRILKRILLSRVFTCYQMLALLQGTVADRQPKVIMDLLASFQDDSVDPVEKDFLLHESVNILSRLSRSAPVIVSISPPTSPESDFNQMFEQVRDVASEFILLENIIPPIQLRLL
jgi:hypothetical protein